MSAGSRKCPRHHLDGGSFNRITRRAACAALALGLTGLMAGCASTGNIAPEALAKADPGKALVLFSISHDWGPPAPLGGRGMGGNVRLQVEISSPALPDQRIQVYSLVTDSLAMMVSSSFEGVWGRWYVRELPPGRYALSTWALSQDTGVGIRTFTPRVVPPELVFEVAAGSITYIGNIHARLGWGRSLLGMPVLAGGLPEVRDEATRDLPLIFRQYPMLEGKPVKALLPLGVWLAPKDTSPYALPQL